MYTSAEFAQRALTNYLTRQVADGKGFRMWGDLYMALPNPDPVLRKTGQEIDILDEIARENHVASCAESREAAVTKKKWAITKEGASPRALEIVEKVFKELPLRNVIREICEAWGYGYQISEVVWRRQGDLLLPEGVCATPRAWFSFGQDGALRLRSSSGDMRGTPVMPYKFLLTQHRARQDNPYGISKYSSCFWPVTFKKGGLKFWAIFLEKFGMPHVVGKQPRSASDEERKALLKSLSEMVQDACAVVPDDSSIEIHQSNASASSDAYERFAAYHDGEISTAILGHSAGATSTPGRLGGEDLAAQVREDIIDNDVSMVEGTLNKLIGWMHELNPSLGAERPAFMLYDPKDIDKPRAERDSMLLNTGKVRFTKKYYIEKYDFKEDEIEVVEPAEVPTLPTAEFAAQAQRTSTATQAEFQEAVDALADGISDDTLQTQTESLLNPVFEAVKNADSLEDLQKKLDGLYGELDDSEIEKGLEKAVLLGEVWGAAAVKGAI